MISGTKVECFRFGANLMSMGWSSGTCSTDAGGTCQCSATVNQNGGMGVVSPWVSNSGTYKTSGEEIAVDDFVRYAYCVSGSTLTVTPSFTILPTPGRIVLQKAQRVA
jgi:hypothetical protein